MTIRNILVPVDFSESNTCVLRFAADMAKALSAQITLLHVFHPPLPQFPEMTLTAQEFVNQSEAASKTRLAELAASLSEGVTVHTRFEDGVPWASIVKVAEDGNYDLIIMGTHGRTGLRHVLLGSVAERVVRHAPCSVTIVRKRTVQVS